VTLAGRIRETIRHHALFAGGERVLVAVSGGPDSVVLLLALHALAAEWRLELRVVHVDHRLRPDSARDAELVTGLAARLGVPVEIVTIDVERRASLEDAAREGRYAALEETRARLGADLIAVGHTADDQAETVLMRILDGAGPRGIAGIPPVRGTIVRPLIDCTRAEILDALRASGEGWIEDPSNADLAFARNRIRHRILPVLARESPAVAAALCRTARLAREAVDALDAVAGLELDEHADRTESSAVTLPTERLRVLPRAVAAEVLRQAAASLGSRAPLRAWSHRGLRRVLALPPPRRPFRLGGVRIDASGRLVRLGLGPPPAVQSRALVVPGSTPLPELNVAIRARVLPAGEYMVSREPRVAAFDADVLGGPLRVRARLRGDRFVPFGGKETRLTHFLIGARVPRWRRDSLPLVDAAGSIVWVAGVRRGAAARITASTRRIMELELLPLAKTGPDG
jgi:tRNA(Ile)-lysidine synthase